MYTERYIYRDNISKKITKLGNIHTVEIYIWRGLIYEGDIHIGGHIYRGTNTRNGVCGRNVYTKGNWTWKAVLLEEIFTVEIYI